MSSRRTFVLPAALALGAVLGLTACGPGGDQGTADARPTRSATAPSSGAAAAPVAPAVASTPGAVSGAGANGAAPAPVPTGKPKQPTAAPAGGGATDDPYAYSHPCESAKLTVRVTARPEAAGQRVIEVRNQGPKACGLSYYPRVDLGDSHAADRSGNVKPLVPGGLGGPPAYALGAGQTAYAVLDLVPGPVAVDQLNVLPDGDHMANAQTLNFPLSPAAKVGKVKLGLYRGSVADAADSAARADVPAS
ncbi:hypothetical protein VM98_25765 [Streptomyces rubellomurinus subsp. indigoferus]|uniref:DUF4232 domain-containing protein n=1 Tax=Streptomyces rubellomurinus (strain ATCC 31215) TaxID=359131 RepID=A0A0F2T8M4_STRR3|nr:DUF4232 domain-containing protein [Streptomyces rubellomurinus]KJS53342.1 hypothetical protein VM98_25765 [Streptomyces rubellomurinus subsp. indigoferus]KJS58675.1 hypothetical protein VM95_31795 [Streptomyces rubellomurinus]